MKLGMAIGIGAVVLGIGALAFYGMSDSENVIKSGKMTNKGKVADWRIINDDGDTVGEIRWNTTHEDDRWEEITRYEESTDPEEVASAEKDVLGVLSTKGYLPLPDRAKR